MKYEAKYGWGGGEQFSSRTIALESTFFRKGGFHHCAEHLFEFHVKAIEMPVFIQSLFAIKI